MNSRIAASLSMPQYLIFLWRRQNFATSARPDPCRDLGRDPHRAPRRACPPRRPKSRSIDPGWRLRSCSCCCRRRSCRLPPHAEPCSRRVCWPPAPHVADAPPQHRRRRASRCSRREAVRRRAGYRASARAPTCSPRTARRRRTCSTRPHSSACGGASVRSPRSRAIGSRLRAPGGCWVGTASCAGPRATWCATCRSRAQSSARMARCRGARAVRARHQPKQS